MTRLFTKVWLFGVLLSVAGCVVPWSQEIPVTRFRNYGSAHTMSHTAYLGSDDTFHYFSWGNGLRGGRWKIRREQLLVQGEFPRTSNKEAFVRNESSGVVSVDSFVRAKDK